MDRFLNSNANKRYRSDSDEVTPASKKPRSCSKQGNVPASVRRKLVSGPLMVGSDL